MRGRIITVLAATAIAALGYGGAPGLFQDLRQHLTLARACVTSGRSDTALAHASLVSPDRVLRVRVDCAGVAAAQQGLYRNALNGAFDLWEAALGQRLFEVVETGAFDVTVQFEPDVNSNGNEVCGRSEWTRGVLYPDTDPVVVFRASVQVRSKWPNGSTLSYEQLRACAAHELGHVLGLEDSPNRGDLMGPMDIAHPALCVRPSEAADLIEARREVRQMRRALSYRTGTK